LKDKLRKLPSVSSVRD